MLLLLAGILLCFVDIADIVFKALFILLLLSILFIFLIILSFNKIVELLLLHSFPLSIILFILFNVFFLELLLLSVLHPDLLLDLLLLTGLGIIIGGISDPLLTIFFKFKLPISLILSFLDSVFL